MVRSQSRFTSEAKAARISKLTLDSLFMQAPAMICVLRGPEHVFDLANPLYLQLVGSRDLIGKPVRQALPELENQGFFELLDRVWETGQPFVGKERSVWFDRRGDGTLEEGFFNFIYQPMYDESGAMEAIMLFAFEVTEQVLARRDAEQLAGRLREANREKDEFIAVISHELRTPMTSILGWARMLRFNDLDAESREAALDAIDRSTKMQAKIIEDLLDDSRLASGKLRLDVRDIDFVRVVEAAIATIRPIAEAKQISLVTDLFNQNCDTTGDPARLQQVVWNVLSNAVKFTGEGGKIFVTLRCDDGDAVLQIRDTGRGIPAELLPYVFDRFRQGGTDTDRQSGLGLGLAIARQLIELHGGEITATSGGLGKGTTFLITLPLSARRQSVEPFVRRDETGRVAVLPELHGVRVLVVEDEFDNRKVIAAVLERCGAEVQCVGTAEQALEETARWRPDVIISDIALPDVDGCTFMRRLRSLDEEQGGRTPALALTVFGRPNEQARILAAGFEVFRQKPIEPADLAHALDRLVRSREA